MGLNARPRGSRQDRQAGRARRLIRRRAAGRTAPLACRPDRVPRWPESLSAAPAGPTRPPWPPRSQPAYRFRQLRHYACSLSYPGLVWLSSSRSRRRCCRGRGRRRALSPAARWLRGTAWASSSRGLAGASGFHAPVRGCCGRRSSGDDRATSSYMDVDGTLTFARVNRDPPASASPTSVTDACARPVPRTSRRPTRRALSAARVMSAVGLGGEGCCPLCHCRPSRNAMAAALGFSLPLCDPKVTRWPG